MFPKVLPLCKIGCVTQGRSPFPLFTWPKIGIGAPTMTALPTAFLIFSSFHRSGSSDPYCLVKVDDEVVARYVVSSQQGVGRGRDPGRRASASQGAENAAPPEGVCPSGFKGTACALTSWVRHWGRH